MRAYLSGEFTVEGTSVWTTQGGGWGAAACRTHSGTELNASKSSLLVANLHVVVIYLAI